MKIGSLVEVINDYCFAENAKAERVSNFPKIGDICIVEEIVESKRINGFIAVGLIEYQECYININFIREIQPPMSLEFINEMQLETA